MSRTNIEVDGLIEVIKSAMPDMTTEELSDMEFAISVELQERASHAQRPWVECECIACRALRGHMTNAI